MTRRNVGVYLRFSPFLDEHSGFSGCVASCFTVNNSSVFVLPGSSCRLRPEACLRYANKIFQQFRLLAATTTHDWLCTRKSGSLHSRLSLRERSVLSQRARWAGVIERPQASSKRCHSVGDFALGARPSARGTLLSHAVRGVDVRGGW